MRFKIWSVIWLVPKFLIQVQYVRNKPIFELTNFYNVAGCSHILQENKTQY